MSRPKILLKDRPHYNDGFLFDIEHISFENKINQKKGRWYKYPEKEVIQQKFVVKISNAQLLHDTQSVSNPFDIGICIKGLVDSPVAEVVPHSELDKSMHFKITIKDLLKLSMTQSTYNYFLRCLDLNINFCDEKQYEYDFKKFLDLERLHMEEENLVNMRVNVKIKYLSIILLTPNRKFLSEIFYNNAKISFVDKGTKDIKITSNKLFILDNPEQYTKQIILAPRNSKNVIKMSDLISTKSKNITNVMDIIMMENGDKSIVWNIDKVKVFTKVYSLMKLMNFFTQGMPDYDYSIDKPNGYYKRNGELESKDPGSRITFIINLNKSYYIMADDPTTEKVVV